MQRHSRQRGTLLILAALLLFTFIGVAFALQLAGTAGSGQRDRITERSLAQAREALIAYAVDRPINATVGAGYLPCPDLDDDGWAESTCGSLSGDSGQAQRLGRLPWKTLGIPDLRDGYGERLWYAVSTKYKGLLNCGVSRACVDMSPASALGTITVRDASGLVIHDGTVAEDYRADASGALAVVLAPGPPLVRADGRSQLRDCAPTDCDADGHCLGDPPTKSPRCDPRNYLDVAAHARFANEDNADFVDRSDTRAGNANGFIRGPVILPDGRLAVNDRLTAIAYRDVMPRLMQRVALEIAGCLRSYASQGMNAGRFPWPTPACLQARGAWDGRENVSFGRIPDTPFAAMASRGNLDHWPTPSNACSIAAADGTTAGLTGNAWWTTWKPYVFYALAPACDAGACIELVDASQRPLASSKRFAVIVAGPPLVIDGFVQRRDASALAEISAWLEGSNARLEGSAGCGDDPPPFACEPAGTCGRVTVGSATQSFNDVVVAFP